MSPKETSSSSSFSKKSSSSSQSKKSKSSRSSLDKLELKVAQLKSASIKSIAPLVISVSHESKTDAKKPEQTDKKTADALTVEKPVKEERVSASEPVVADSKANNQDDDKMDLDNDLFEGRLVIAEPDPPSKDDSESSIDHLEGPSPKKQSKPEDPEDEEIDVVDDGEVDSGRGSDISSRAEARSLSGDDDLGSPESVPKTPDSVGNHPISIPKPPVPSISEQKEKTPKINGVGNNSNPAAISNGDSCVLDLSTCGRKRNHEGETLSHRSKPVANPAVLDKTRQTPCRSPDHPSFKVLSSVLPNPNAYKMKSENTGRNFKCRGNTLTVINPDPNGNRPKIVIRNLGPRPDRHDRFHHNHHHHHHHQRM